MRKQSSWKRWVRGAMVLAVGGSAFQLSGCDPAIRSVLFDGLEATTQNLSSALISAFFLSFQDEDGTSDGLTTT